MADDGNVLRFGVFEADRRSGELRRRGLRVRLQEQPFQVLVMLAERAGEVVTREELRLKLWPSDTFVDFDHGLNTAINKLRDALGDSATSPRFIETLPRRGYRFVAPVENAVAGSEFPKAVPSSEFQVPRAVPSSEFKVPTTPVSEDPHDLRSASELGTRNSELVLDVPEHNIPHAPRILTRALFALAQIMYLIFYVVALFRLDHLHEVVADAWAVPVMVAIVITAPIGIALRLYFLSAVGFDYAKAGTNFLKLFRFVFVLDLIWALAPFLITIYIGVGGAIAACAALVYLPFSQRTLMRMAYRSIQHPASSIR